MPAHSHTANTTVISTVIDEDVVANLKAVDTKAQKKTPDGNALAKSKKENIYSQTAPTVNMHPDSIELNLGIVVNSTATTTINPSGSSVAHENRMPYLAVNWIIATTGIYPSRN